MLLELGIFSTTILHLEHEADGRYSIDAIICFEVCKVQILERLRSYRKLTQYSNSVVRIVAVARQSDAARQSQSAGCRLLKDFETS